MVLPRNLSTELRRVLGESVEDHCQRTKLPAKALALDAGCDVRTIRNFFSGKSVKGITIRKICDAAKFDLDGFFQRSESITRSADREHGSYTEELVEHYIGYFWAYRRDFFLPNVLLRSLYEFRWDSSKSCLRFQEYQTYETSNPKRRVNNDQSGDVFISNTVGLVHLLTSRLGALRLISLTRLHHDQRSMQGVVLTQARLPDHHQMAVSPIYFERIANANSHEQYLKSVGPIREEGGEGEELYSRIPEIFDQIETQVVKFPK